MKKWSDMKGKEGKKVTDGGTNDSALVFVGWHLFAGQSQCKVINVLLCSALERR